MASDMRYYETFYAINTDDWGWTFGSFSDHNKVLVKDYINEGCVCAETSTATDTNEFIYPHHIKKKYFIEGVIEGHITIAASTATSTVTSYRVSVCKINQDSTKTELFTTGWKTVDTELAWDSTYSIGEERVYPFSIDAWEYATLDEYDRIYLKIEVSGSNTCVLWHSNDGTWEDVKLELPLRLE